MDLDIFWSLSSSSSDESTLSESSPLIFFTKNCPAGASIDLFTAVLFIMVETRAESPTVASTTAIIKELFLWCVSQKEVFFATDVLRKSYVSTNHKCMCVVTT
jgi:hypothetical protein